MAGRRPLKQEAAGEAARCSDSAEAKPAAPIQDGSRGFAPGKGNCPSPALACHPTTQFAKGTLTFISDAYCSEEQYEEYYFSALGKISKSNIESGLQHMPRRLL